MKRELFLSITLVLAITLTADAVKFQGLGDLMGGPFASVASGVSADGNVVVGNSIPGEVASMAIRWTESEGMQGLGLLPGTDFSIAYGVSANGMVIVGESSYKAFRWTESGGIQDLEIPDCGAASCFSFASGVSGDGLVIVGKAEPPEGESGHAFRWTASGGTQFLGESTDLAFGASYDGSVIAGYGGTGAFRWTGSGGIQFIDERGMGGAVTRGGISPDGSVIVGTSRYGTDAFEAFRWTQLEGMQYLGFLPGTSISNAYSVSADGTVVVGMSGDYSGWEAFIWDVNHGMRNLEDVLEIDGMDITGWNLLDARGVSGDGLVIVGYGLNPVDDVEGFIAKLTRIKDINENRHGNMESHHTNGFDVDQWNELALILRRGGTFEVEVKLSSELAPPLQICFKAEYFYDNNWISIDIPYFENIIPSDQWGTTRIDSETPEDPDVNMMVNIPPDAAAGLYKFKAILKRGDVNTPPADEKYFPYRAGILFNPWASADSVYMPSNLERIEYVQNEKGRIWQKKGSITDVKQWSFDQFDETSFNIVVNWLDKIEPEERSNPIYVSRYFSEIANCIGTGDEGILIGRWPKIPGDFPNGTIPSLWENSGEILEQYYTSGNPVKYGQCWVFGGILTTLLRSVGIPARPITNFDSLHDKTPGVNKIYDYFKTKDWDKLPQEYCDDCLGPVQFEGYRRDVCRSDGFWDFHVWCEAWMNRPDRPGLNGWQVVDGTPQEPSDGKYQLGPAPVSAVQQDLGGIYDVNFVFAEVNTKMANIWKYTVDANGQMHDPNAPEIVPVTTGLNISTKAVLSNNRNDITSSYKYTGPKGQGSFTVLGSSDVTIDFSPPEIVPLGDDFVWTVNLFNTSEESRTVEIFISGETINYRGDAMGEADRVSQIVNLGPNGSNSVELVISESEYSYGLPEARTLEATVSLGVYETGQEFFDPFKRTFLTNENIDITIVPDSNFYADETITCEARWTNPLSTTLHNVIVRYIVDKTFSIDGEQVVDINIPDLGPGEVFFTSKEIIGSIVDTGMVSVELRSDELQDVRGWAEIVVIPYADFNRDRIVNFLDYSHLVNDWQTVDSNYSLDDDNDVDIDDLFLFAGNWLWTDPPIEQGTGGGGESYTTMSLEVAPIESTSIEEAAVESVQEPETPLPEQIKMIRDLIEWSEALWSENEDIRNMVGEERWLEFMRSLYEELEILEERNEQQSG